jgi:hypothetical protein
VGEVEQDKGRAFELRRTAQMRREPPQDSDDRRAARKEKDEDRSGLPERLHQKYYVIEDEKASARIYADPQGEYLVAKTSPERLITRVASLEIVRDLVAIAAHRGWEKIEVSGALEFRREAWLAASARGIEVKGYEPTELDCAALAKLQGRAERESRTHAPERARAGETARQSPSTDRADTHRADERNVRSHLAVIQRVALAAFPKDPEARKRVLEAARERIAHHRRSGGHFERAEVPEKTKPAPEKRKASERTKVSNRISGNQRVR